MSEYTTEQLLAELIKRCKTLDAPRKILLSDGHKTITVGIGKDDYATIIIHSDGMSLLCP